MHATLSAGFAFVVPAFLAFAVSGAEAPPPTTQRPVDDVYFGTPITDRYRWLEELTVLRVAQFAPQRPATLSQTRR